jgi:glutamate racemase
MVGNFTQPLPWRNSYTFNIQYIRNTMTPSQPIGIFDSGIGGLTVAKAIAELLPNESIVYFGDTEHMPYGAKSVEHIKGYSMRIAEFLESKNVKLIVIACNSASSVAYYPLCEKYGNKLNVIGVINPVAEHIAKQRYLKVGVIGTKPTIKSKAYEQEIAKQIIGTKVASLATPLLAPMIEEGFYNNNISQTIINSYLSNRKFTKLNALILACTHYPLIKKEVTKFYKKSIDIIDPAILAAQKVEQILRDKKLLYKGAKKKDQFFVSEYTESFATSTKIFYNKEVDIAEVDLWQDR